MRYPKSSEEDKLSSLPVANPTTSLWLTDLSDKLRDHRTTKTLPQFADVVVIGSGICGTNAAWELFGLNDDGDEADGLSQRGKLDVVMLEAREACSGATGRNGGHCQALLYRLNNAYPEAARFEIRNWQFVKSLVDKYNVECEWQTHPGCHVYMDREEFEAISKVIAKLKVTDADLGKHITILTPDSKEPSLADYRLNPDAAGAVLMQPAGNLWPYKLVAYLLEQLLEKFSAAVEVTKRQSAGSFNLQTNTPATSLQKLPDGSWIVHTPRGMIATKAVILTTNAYTSHLVPEFRDIIVPTQGQVAALRPPGSLNPNEAGSRGGLPSAYGFTVPGKDGSGGDDYLMQRPLTKNQGGELIFGGGRTYSRKEGVGVSDDSHIDEDVAQYLRRNLYNTLNIGKSSPKGSRELSARYEWTGIMGYSRDFLPWVGRVPGEEHEGLWMAAGFTGHGMPNAPLSGRAIAKLFLTDGKGPVDLPGRYFASNERLAAARAQPEVKEWETLGLMPQIL